MRKISILLFVNLIFNMIAIGTFAQQKEVSNKYLEFNYEKKAIKERKAIPYPSLREADVVYAKRVQRLIDTREKKNLPLKWQQNPLYNIIHLRACTGDSSSPSPELKAYITDTLTSVYNAGDVRKKGATSTLTQYAPYPDDPTYLMDTTVYTPFDPVTIVKYFVNEEWIFDKQRGMFYPRIIAIAPVYKPILGGIELDEQPMYWVSYPELRNILVNEETFNRQNDALRLSYYDYFEQRWFSSYITKETNEYGYAIKDFPEYKDSPIEALYESERIKSEIFNWEHDLWEY